MEEDDDEPHMEPVLITELGVEEQRTSNRKLLFTGSMLDGALRLPAAINGIALRESFLSEAPFIVASNRPFWRKMIDNSNFQNILCYTYYFLSTCISDTSVVDVKKLSEINDTDLIKQIPANLAELYLTIPLKERDAFLPRFPEVLSYLLINAMRTTTPKHYRLMGMAQFREILLDWATELICGLRLSNCRLNREWFFADTSEGAILTNPSQFINRSEAGVAKKRMIIHHSPLIQMFIEPLKLPSSEKPLTLTVSHRPSRSLTALSSSNELPSLANTLRIREDSMDHNSVKKLLGKTNKRCNTRMAEYKKNNEELNKTVRTIRNQLKQELQTMKISKPLPISPPRSPLGGLKTQSSI